MENYFEAAVIGSTAFSVGICENFKENAVVIEFGDMPVYEFCSAFYSDCKESYVNLKTEKARNLKKEFINRKVISKESGNYPDIFMAAPLFCEKLTESNATHYFRTNILEISKQKDIFSIKLFTTGGVKTIYANYIVDTTADKLSASVFNVEKPKVQSKVICAAVYNSEKIENYHNDRLKIFKSDIETDGYLQFFASKDCEYLNAHHELYEYWCNRPKSLEKYMISDIASSLFETAVENREEKVENYYWVPSSNYGNFLSAYEAGTEFSLGGKK